MESVQSESVVPRGIQEQADLTKEELLDHAKKYQLSKACTKHDEESDTYTYLPLCGKESTPAKLGAYGVGVELYFNFLTQMGGVFLLWTCMSLPALSFFLMGNLVPDTGSFFDYLAKTTVANFGVCPESGPCDYRERCIRTVDHPESDDACPLKVNESTEFIGVFDGIALLLFLVFSVWFDVYWIPRRVQNNDDKNLTAADFSVSIDCLPYKLKPEDDHVVAEYRTRLQNHLTNILKRHGINDENAVREIELVHDRNGAIRSFIEIGNLKKAHENSQVMKVKAAQEGEAGKKKSDKLELQTAKLYEQIEKNRENLKSDTTNPGVVRAFVMFDKESYKEAILNEYRFAEYSLFRLCEKEHQRFEGAKIHVTQAPEPSDLYWENLDTPKWNRRCRLCLTFVVTIILLLICGFLLVLSQAVKPSVPTIPTGATWIIQPVSYASFDGCANLCNLNLFRKSGAGCALEGDGMDDWAKVQLFDMNTNYGSMDFSSGCSTGPVWSSPQCGGNATYNTTDEAWRGSWLGVTFQESQQPECLDVLQQSATDFATELRLYSCGSTAIPSDRSNWYPEDHCEPLSPVSTTSANSGKQLLSIDTTCAIHIPYEVAEKAAASDEKCEASQVVDCFCMQAVQEWGSKVFTSSSTSDADLVKARAVCEKWECKTWSNYSMMGVGALLVLVVNQVLLIIFNFLIDFERHERLTDKTRAELWKLFLAQFMNTGLLILAVNMRVDNNDAFFVTIKSLTLGMLLNGQYDETGPAWFIAVGAGLAFTICIQVFSCTITPIIMSKVVHPIMGYCFRGGAATKRTMEDLFILPEWNLALRLAQTMTVFFCILMYSGGMPILNIVGFVYCIIAYWADKWCLLRGSQKPPMYDEDILKFIMHFMPVMAMLHAVAAGFVFGNQLMFPSDWRTFLGAREVVFWFLNMDLDQYDEWRKLYATDPVQGAKNAHYVRMADFCRKAPYILCVVIILGVVYYVLKYVYIFLLRPFLQPAKLMLVHFFQKHCCGSRRRSKKGEEDDENEETYNDMIEVCAKHNRLASYKMKENWLYGEACEAIDAEEKIDFAEEAASREATEAAAAKEAAEGPRAAAPSDSVGAAPSAQRDDSPGGAESNEDNEVAEDC
jgi:hypothetical protein